MKKINKPKIIFSDFDGTLTDHTEFSTKFIDIINLADEHDIPFVIVTGRSLSWAHFFLTHFGKLNYVISEGGGVLSRRDERGLIVDEFQVGEDKLAWLEKFSKKLTARYTDVTLSADSIGRKSDRAIELSDLEEPETLDKIKMMMEIDGISYSTSNVHMNFWCGDMSKYQATVNFLKKYMPHISIEESVFFGDSLNDQTMFHGIEHSVGVSNISEVLDRMSHHPTVILRGEANKGPSGVLSYLRELLK